MSDPQISELSQDQMELKGQTISQENLDKAEVLQQRAIVLDMAIKQMLSKHGNLYNFLVVSRQLYFIVLASLKEQLTPEFFKQFLPANEEPTLEEMQLVLNAICQKTAMTPEYPASISSHFNFLNNVMIPWLEAAAVQEQKLVIQDRQVKAEERLKKQINLTDKLGEQASIIKRKSVSYFHKDSVLLLNEFRTAINDYVKECGLSAGFILDEQTDFDEHVLSVKNTFKNRQKFTNKTVLRLFSEYVSLTTEVPDILLIDLRGSFVTTHTTLKIVDKQLSSIADKYGVAVVCIVDNQKLSEWRKQ